MSGERGARGGSRIGIRLANTTNTPVALHLTGGVAVVGAGETIECDVEDVALGQVTALCRQGVLVAHPQSPPPGDVAAPSSESPPKRRRRSTGRRGPN